MLFTVLDQMKITTITKIKNLMSDCFNSLFSLQKIKVDKKFPIFIMDNIDSEIQYASWFLYIQPSYLNEQCLVDNNQTYCFHDMHDVETPI